MQGIVRFAGVETPVEVSVSGDSIFLATLLPDSIYDAFAAESNADNLPVLVVGNREASIIILNYSPHSAGEQARAVFHNDADAIDWLTDF